MSETENTTDVWSRLGRTIGRLSGMLLRVLFVIVIAVLLAAGVYFGAPWVYRQFIQPVQSSVAQLTLLQGQIEEANTRWAQSFGEQQQRITDLESQLAGQGERVASLEASLSRIDEALVAQQTTLETLSATVNGLPDNYASAEEIETLRDDLAALWEGVSLADQTAAQIEALEYRATLIQVWQETLKTHIYLTAGNVGNAAATLELAAAHIEQAAALSPKEEQGTLDAIQTRLTQAASRLREQPILAAQDLESAWYELDALITVPE